MRNLIKIISGIGLVILLSACGAIPTLPPLDSTVTIRTPYITIIPGGWTATAEQPEPTVLATSKPGATEKPQLTPTNTKIPGSPTQAASKTAVPSKTATKVATETPTKTPTKVPTKTATYTPTFTFTPTAVPFALQQLNPYYLANFTHPDLGCSWMGVAGQIFSKDGQVQKQVVIKAGGTIKGKTLIETMVMPLAEPAVDLSYGPGGFELTLANAAAATNQEAWIQLYNLAGQPLSEKIFLVTYDNCLKNLILINFSAK